jgi:hypothetical protein
MRIPSESTIAACEAALLELHNEREPDTLVLPTNYKHGLTGGECSWVQFLVTWLQSRASGKIMTYAKNAEDAQIEQLSGRLFGIVACLSGVPMLAANGVDDLAPIFESKAHERLAAFQSNNPKSATKGPSIEVVAADHLGMSCPVFLYRLTADRLRVLRPREDFVRLARYLLFQSDNKSAQQEYDEELCRSVGSLLFETYKNTEDHALTSIQGERLQRSFRLFQAATISVDPESLIGTSKEFPPLADYFRDFGAAKGGHQARFFVLSVLDSGPGFASTWTGKPLEGLTLEAELQATIDCFSKGSRKGQDRFGQGLPLLRTVLKRRRGFLRLRTGRQSLYYRAADDNDTISGSIPLLSSRTEADPELAPVAGTLLTLILPARGMQ